MYTKEKPLTTKTNACNWWKMNRECYLKLSSLAWRILSFPVTSVPAKRVFSKAGGTVTKLGAALDLDFVD